MTYRPHSLSANALHSAWCSLSSVIKLAAYVLLSLFIATSSMSTSADNTSKNSEHISRSQKIKAAYLYHLTKFIDWPQQHSNKLSDSINVCVVGESQFTDFLQQLESKKAKGRPIDVIPIKPSEKHTYQCHIVFYQESKTDKSKQLMDFVNHGTLTVGEQNSFTDEGGMVSMVIIENHINLMINYTLTKRAGILVSANLLEVATIVE